MYKSDGAAQHGLDKVGVREEFAEDAGTLRFRVFRGANTGC